MALYLIETTKGPRGPYTTEEILRGARQGTIPLGAKLTEQSSGEATTVAAVIQNAQAATAPAEPSVPAKPSAPAARLPARRKAGYPGPQAPSYAPQPGYHQPPAQPDYGQQSAYPYPGNAGPRHPQHGHQQSMYRPYGQQMPYPAQITPSTSGLAITSLVLSLVTLTFCIPLWIGGIICGFIALGDCQPNGPKAGRGLALAGIWSGVGIGLLYVGGIVWFFWGTSGQSW